MSRPPLAPCTCVRDEYGFAYSVDCARHGIYKTETTVKGGRKSLNQKSHKQEIREAFLAGIKASRIYAMWQRRGGAFCDGCDKEVLNPLTAFDSTIEPDEDEFIERAMSCLDAHHIHPRSSGRGFAAPTSHGVDSPTNLVLLCRKCHSATEPDPQWSSASDRADASQGRAAPPPETP